MKHEVKEISQTVKELKITIEAKEAQADYREVLVKFKKYVQIPGFRKGKAPVSKVEKMYGDYAIEQFYDEKLGKYYKAALAEIDENPINAGEATDVKWEKGKDLVATFRFEVMPEIKVEKYKELEIPFEPTEFKAEMVDGTIKEFQEQMATTKEVEGEIAAGDTVKAKIGFIAEDGKISKEIEREFVVDDNPYCKSFNNKVIGSKVGDEFDNMLFTKSANSQDSEIGEKFYGKDFHVTILAANQKELPEINDEFAKDMEYDSLSHLRETVESELKKKLENEDKDKLRSAIIGELIKQNPFDLPHSLVHKYAEDMAKPYAEAYKMEIDQLLPMYEQLADFNMKSHYLINEIKKLEDIKFTEDDREKLIAAEAAKAGEELEKYKELNKSRLESQDFLYIAEEEKVLDLIKASSTFVEVPQEKTAEEK